MLISLLVNCGMKNGIPIIMILDPEGDPDDPLSQGSFLTPLQNVVQIHL